MIKISKKSSFEETIKQLKATVEKMQTIEMSLDSLIDHYESGLQLKQHAYSLLSNAKLRIQRIQQNNNMDIMISNISNKLLGIYDRFMSDALEEYKDSSKEPDWNSLLQQLSAEFDKFKNST